MTDGPGASRGCAAPMGAVPGGHPELTEVASLEDIVAALADVQSLQEELGILSPHGAPATDRSMGGQTAGGPSSSSPAAQLDQPSDGGGSQRSQRHSDPNLLLEVVLPWGSALFARS